MGDRIQPLYFNWRVAMVQQVCTARCHHEHCGSFWYSGCQSKLRFIIILNFSRAYSDKYIYFEQLSAEDYHHDPCQHCWHVFTRWMVKVSPIPRTKHDSLSVTEHDNYIEGGEHDTYCDLILQK